MPRALAWQTPLKGLLEVPGSKSIAQRALLLGALAPGRTQLLGDLSSADVQHMLTRTPRPHSSLAAERVKPITPALEAA